ncbi:MAG: hypothetical protein ACYCOU_04330, partial [Sulfobacillus sp.]
MFGGGCQFNAGTQRCRRIPDEPDDDLCEQGLARCQLRKGHPPIAHVQTEKQAIGYGWYPAQQKGAGCRFDGGTQRCRRISDEPDDDLCEQGKAR